MMNSSYLRRIEADVPRWQDAGWLAEEGARAIVEDVRARETAHAGGLSNRLISVLALLGAVLFGAGILSFVAANWQEMPRLARLGLLVGGLWAAYGGAAFLFSRSLSIFAHAAVLIGATIFGASVMLVAQMYHLHGNPPDAVLVWAAGALMSGVVFRSNPTLVVSLLLVCLWGGWETQIREGVFLPFVPAWAVVAAALAANSCRYGLKVASAAIAVWMISLGYTLDTGHAHELVLALGVATAGCGFALQSTGPRFAEYGRLAFLIGFVVAIAALLALQFIVAGSLGMLLVLAVVTLGVAIGGIALGLRGDDRLLTRTGYAAFAVEVLALFLRTVGTLMGSSLFFVVAGAGVIALAAGAFFIDRRLRASRGDSQ